MEKKPWFEAAFDADYLERYPHRDEAEAATAAQTFLRQTQIPAGSLTLDLCCGAGRHSRALKARRLNVVGMDLSLDLLVAAQRQNPAIPVTRGDMRSLPFADGSFDAVTHFFTAFGYFESDHENFEVFSEVARVLRPGGWYLFDFFSEPFIRASFRGQTEEIDDEVRSGGLRVRTIKMQTARRIIKTIRWIREGVLEREIMESVRLFRPEDIRPALSERGFHIQEEWGRYDGAAYDPQRSSRYIVLAKKAE